MSVVFLNNADTTQYCPPRGTENNNLHPRVALKFKDGVAKCPYCSVKFQIKDG